MSQFTVFVVALLTCVILRGNVEAYRVLGVFPMPTYSHFSLGARLMNELVERGHDVTFLNPYKDDKAKYKNVQITGMQEWMEVQTKKWNMFENAMNPIIGSVMIHISGIDITDQVLKNPNTQKLIHSNEKFDVVIIEQFINDAMKGFCAHFNASCVLVNSVRTVYWSNLPMGNPANPSYIPGMMTHAVGPMSFWTRFKNTLLITLSTLHYYAYFIPGQNALVQKYFPNPPQLQDIMNNIAVMFLNSDISSAPPVPLLPNMVEIGGYHVKEPKKLPEDLQKYLDNAKNGVIYFSMGSNLKSKDIPQEKKAAILKALGSVKENVLWKFEEDLPGKPANVRIDKWFPQADVLAHPNVKLFITHGGLLGTLESIYHGVPVMGIPVYGDQEMNMLRAVDRGYGTKVSFMDLNEERLTNALHAVLNNPSYAKNAKEYSKLLHDQPMKPIDKAMFWIDYAVRHKGETHFRSAALDLSWYQYFLLDVIAVIALASALCVATFVWIVKRLCMKKKAATKSKVKKQ